jgi:hypothetical protein
MLLIYISKHVGKGMSFFVVAVSYTASFGRKVIDQDERSEDKESDR